MINRLRARLDERRRCRRLRLDDRRRRDLAMRPAGGRRLVEGQLGDATGKPLL